MTDRQRAEHLRDAFCDLSERFPGIGLISAAHRMGVAEGLLAQALCAAEDIAGVTCRRLEGPWEDLFEDLVDCGPQMVVLGGDGGQAVHLLQEAEVVGGHQTLSLRSPAVRVVLTLPLAAVVAVRESRGCACGGRLAVVVYDHAGEALCRLFRTPGANRQALEEVLEAHHAPEQDEVVGQTPPPAGEAPVPTPVPAPSLLVAQRLRATWASAGAPDIASGVLASAQVMLGLDRLAVLDLLGAPAVLPVGVTQLSRLFTAVAGAGVPLVFVPRCGTAQGNVLFIALRYTCEERVHHLVAAGISVRIPHDDVVAVRCIRHPGAAGPIHGLEGFDARRRRIWALVPDLDAAGSEPAAWRSAMAVAEGAVTA